MNDEVEVSKAPMLDGRVASNELLQSTCTLTAVLEPTTSGGLLFHVSCTGYELRVGIDRGHVFTRRNGQVAAIPIDLAKRQIVTWIWSPERIFVEVAGSDGVHSQETKTPFTVVPTTLLNWARQRATATRETPFENAANVLEEICDQLAAIGPKLRNTGGWACFWDVHYDGSKIVSRAPKKERDVNPMVHSLICDIEVTKGIQIYPEHPAGNARMDFLFTAPTSGGLANVCSEFKLAHSRDLANGLQRQLPEYMTRKLTEYGVFVVLDYGPEFSPSAEFDLPGYDGPKNELQIAMQLAAGAVGRTVKTIVIPVYPEPSPSK